MGSRSGVMLTRMLGYGKARSTWKSDQEEPMLS